ncbi:MAG: 50S ribosomal protein L40e [Candidatus Aenigmarchaeota archaeon]|nr:50S ribosomal protein L40e [Candidatus Aenigmarchaeota archaeon]
MGKTKFPEAEARIFQRVFVCMRCSSKIRADMPKVRAGKVKCRVCKSKSLRAIHKEKK